jgi:hypothetical protein
LAATGQLPPLKLKSRGLKERRKKCKNLSQF